MTHGLPDGEYIIEQEGILFDIIVKTNEDDIQMVSFLDFPEKDPVPLLDLVGQVLKV
jgi:hypothetical protein